MTLEEKLELIVDLIVGLSEQEKISYLTIFFHGFNNLEIARMSGYIDEDNFDKCKEKK